MKQLREKSIKDYEAHRSEDQRKRDHSLVMAHNGLISTILRAIEQNVVQAIEHDPLATSTTVVNPHKGATLHGHTLTYVWHGLYNSEKDVFSRRHHHLAGLTDTVLVDLNKILKVDGIDQVLDVTDPHKNGDLVLKVFFEV